MLDEPAVVATLPNPRWLPEWLVHPGPVTPPGPTAWSTQLPDGLLADLLEQQRGEPGAFERLERIGAWERVIAWAQANQLREMADHAHEEDRRCREEAERRALDRAAGLRVPPEVFAVDGVESAAAELALMLRCAPATATSRLSDALTLTGRFPATVSALHTGRITLSKARTIAEQTEQLSDAHAATVEARAGADPGGQPDDGATAAVRAPCGHPDGPRRGAAAPPGCQGGPGGAVLGPARRDGDRVGLPARSRGAGCVRGARRVRSSQR